MGTETYKCPWCEVIKSLRGLSCHASKTHKKSSQETHLHVLHDGVIPLCACGCGRAVKWQQKRYAKYAARGCNGFNVKARTKAVEAKREMAKNGELTSWNAGLTKETDPRVAVIALKNAESADGVEISKRLAGRSDEEKRLHRERISKAKVGSVPWNIGLSKENTPSLQTVAEKNRVHARRRFGWKDKPHLILQAAEVRSDKLHLVDFSMYEGKRSSLLFECVECKSRIKRSLHVLRYSPDCPACVGTDTKPQLELYEYVKSMSEDAILSDATFLRPRELDVHVPSKNVAIEYNGLYWHSEKFRDRSYHQQKSNACALKNTQLLHVYADDWEFRQSIVKSMIAHRLGKTKRKIQARKCSIRKVSSTERRQFFESSHLDGDTQSNISFGLEFEDKLVAVMSLRKPFHKKWHDRVEVARFATTLDTAVTGGLSRLTTHVIAWAKLEGYKGILTYVDGRVGEGVGYTRSGFVKYDDTPPMFWWTDYKRRYNRFNFRADKQRGMSEREVAEEAGVVKVYGCSSAVMTIDF